MGGICELDNFFPDKSLGQGFFPQNRKRDGLSPTLVGGYVAAF